MDQTERQKEILSFIFSGECTNVKDLSRHIYASPATIRRDLHCLEEAELIRLSYGNIIPLTKEPTGPWAFRINEAKNAKRKIAKYAAEMIPANSTVILDASSSALYIAEYLSPNLNLTVFTNCMKTAIQLCEHNITIYYIGGKVVNRNFVTTGSWAEEAVASINADYFFFSSKNLGYDGLITAESEDGARMRKLMIKHSANQFFLCNAEKIGRKSTFALCSASDITGVISDADLSAIPNINAIHVPG